MPSELGSGMVEHEVGTRYQVSFRMWMKQSSCLSQACYLNHTLPPSRLAPTQASR